MKRAMRFIRVALAARRIQDFLWGKAGKRIDQDGPACWEDWVQNLEKRLRLARTVDPSHPHWRIMAKKRLLQLATVAVAMMEAIDAGAVEPPK